MKTEELVRIYPYLNTSVNARSFTAESIVLTVSKSGGLALAYQAQNIYALLFVNFKVINFEYPPTLFQESSL